MGSLFSPPRSLWARWLLLCLPFADVNEVLSKSEQEIKLDFSIKNWHSTKEGLKIMKMKLIKKWCWWYHSFVFCFQWWQNFCITCIHTACCPRTRPRSIRLKKKRIFSCFVKSSSQFWHFWKVSLETSPPPTWSWSQWHEKSYFWGHPASWHCCTHSLRVDRPDNRGSRWILKIGFNNWLPINILFMMFIISIILISLYSLYS